MTAFSLRRTGPAIAFLVVVVLLLVRNIHVIVRNQSDFEPNDVLASRSANIAVIASHDTMFVVRTTFATYHRLRRFAGKHVVISPERTPHQFAFERVSRLEIEVAPARIELPRRVIDRITQRDAKFEWELENDIALNVVEDPAATRYVLVESDDRRATLLLPEAAYQRALAEPR